MHETAGGMQAPPILSGWNGRRIASGAHSLSASASVTRNCGFVGMANNQDREAYRGKSMRPGLHTLADLPPVDTKRWVPKRKAALITAVETGLISPEDACRRYKLTMEEYTGWKVALKEFGPGGLKTTKRMKRQP